LARNYFHILGLTKSASLKEIKSAYRSKAKLLHPDVNSSPNAQEEFVQLHEAYEYLLHFKTGKTIGKRRRSGTRKYSQREWEKKERDKARARARARAKKRYQAQLNSDEYKLSIALLNLTKASFIFLTLSSPIWLSIILGPKIIFACLVVIILVLTSFSEIFKSDFYREVRTGYKVFIKSKVKFAMLYLILNGFCLFVFAFKTVVPHILLIFLYLLLLSIGVWQITRFFDKDKAPKNLLKIYGGITLAVSFFFLLNFSFSGDSNYESYSYTLFTKNKNNRIDRRNDIGFIFLENDAYDKQIWTRAVFDLNKYKGRNQITLEVSEGLFGLDVIKSIKVNRK